MQATGQAETQSATPSQISVTIECGTVFSPLILNITLPLLGAAVPGLESLSGNFF
jgi:hypothetical protein